MHTDRNQLAKEFDSAAAARGAEFARYSPTFERRNDMTQKTCAACDCPLDDTAINVKLGGRTVEVCCEECAVKLKEAYVSASTPQKK